ncbi:MAG TPA: DUF3488 domain-containing protein [Gammaproteobacteria bacterium]|nr:DUF3488 domain-containing protein [Gammaproteobacteria bacterium]
MMAVSLTVFNWLLATLSVVLLPHVTHIPLWVSLTWIAIAFWRYVIARYKYKLPSALVRLTLVLTAIIAVVAQFGTLLGRDAGVSLLIVMLALKLLEIRQQRDVIITLFLAYFLILSQFLFDQSAFMVIYLVLGSWLVTSTWMLSQQTMISSRRALKQGAVLLLQSIPVMLILFLLFPRIQGPLWKLPGDSEMARTGISDSMSPGSISKLSLSNEVAFRVEFEQNTPEHSTLYWRGPVLWDYDGRSWHNNTSAQKVKTWVASTGKPVRYSVTLEAHNRRWLFGLDYVVAPESNMTITTDGQLLSRNKVDERIRYKLVSRPVANWPPTLPAAQRSRALEIPPNGNPRSRQMAQRLSQEYPDIQQRTHYLLQYFGQDPFTYTLNPPRLGKNSIDEFLFTTRRGFCEHYASSFVFIMRASGIPARVVTGYQGGEYNTLGNYLIVRQSDAHAWAEVWLDQQGWVRIDPTAAIAPERIEYGIEAALPEALPVLGLLRTNISFLRNLVLAWDGVNNLWNIWVMSYGPELQNSVLRRLGILNWTQMAIWMTALSSLIVALYLLVWWKKERQSINDPVVNAYMQLCRKLQRAGIRRRTWEGPLDFAQRIKKIRPDLYTSIGPVLHAYQALRYEPTGRSRYNRADLVKAMRRVKLKRNKV